MNNYQKKLAERKRQMARVTFSSRRHEGKYSVYLDKKKIGFYHLVSLKDNKTHTGAYTKSINENTHYWLFVDERTDPAYRRTSSISTFFTGGNDHRHIQHKVAGLVPFPLPVLTEQEKEERAQWTALIDGIMGGVR